MYTPYQKFISQNPDVERIALQREMEGKIESKVDSILNILKFRFPNDMLIDLAKQALGDIHDIQVLNHLEDKVLKSKDEEDIYEWLNKYLSQSNIEDKVEDKADKKEQTMATFDDTLSITQTNLAMRSTDEIRKDFPILSRQVHDKPLVYLDSTASSQKPTIVLETMEHYYRAYNANIHRGVYQISEEATAAVDKARVKIARFINARQSKQVIFTRNTTESINLVAYSWGAENIHAGDLIVLTEMEHHSNLVPWQLLAQRAGARLEFVPVSDDGLLRLDIYEQLLQQQPKLVAFTHMSNVLGTINPAKEMIAQAHTTGAIVLLDAAQSVPHLPVDVQDLDVDFLAFSGHKMLGPTGIGVLYGKKALLEAMPPFMGGGDMIRSVHLRESTWNDLPWKFEAGTPAIAEAIGLGAAVDYLNTLGMTAVQQHEREITIYALEQLQLVPGLKIYGPDASQRGGVISFILDDIHPHDLASILDQEVGVAIRAGHHCAQPLMDRFELAATARASFYIYTLPEEIDILVQGLRKAQEIFHF